jgi:hypothetical protein
LKASPHPATEQSIRGLLAAFALEHRDTFIRFCESQGEDAEGLLDWRVETWAEAYRLDAPGLRQASGDPLFEAGPTGPPRLDARWAERVRAFCDAVHIEVGAHPKVQCWPYRIGTATCLAFDASGDSGEVNLTFLEGRATELPLDGTKLGHTDSVVMDAVDAFYLVARLLEALGLPAQGEGIMLHEPRDSTAVSVDILTVPMRRRG